MDQGQLGWYLLIMLLVNYNIFAIRWCVWLHPLLRSIQKEKHFIQHMTRKSAGSMISRMRFKTPLKIQSDQTDPQDRKTAVRHDLYQIQYLQWVYFQMKTKRRVENQGKVPRPHFHTNTKDEFGSVNGSFNCSVSICQVQSQACALRDVLRKRYGDYNCIMNTTESLISQDILNNLHHKNNDRKEVAYRTLVEKIVLGIGRLELLPAQKVIVYFTEKYFSHPLSTHKRIAIELFEQIVKGMKDFNQELQMLMLSIISPILECFNDPDPKIRFQAIRTIYNITREVDGRLILKLFVPIFDELIGKTADLDVEVVKAAACLNDSLQSMLINLMPTATNFSLKQLVMIIAEKIKSPNSIVKQYLLSWINTLNEMHNINIIPYLPILLKDLLLMLGDKEKEVKTRAEITLKNYIDEIEQLNIDNKLQKVLTEDEFDQIIRILIQLNMGKTSSHTKRATIAFFQQLVRFVMRHIDPADPFILKRLILIHLHEILKCIFVSLGHDQEQVRRATLITNEQLLIAVGRLKGQKDIDLGKLMDLLNNMLQENKVTTLSECVLQWTKFVLENYNHEVLPSINDTIVNLIRKICESHSTNVLNLIQNVSMKQEYFDLVIDKLLNILNSKHDQMKIEGVLNKLYNVLNVERIFVSISSQMLKIQSVQFKGQMVYALNSILVTSQNTLALRKKLRRLDVEENRELFKILFKAFSYNPVCVLSLCFMSQEYSLAKQILLEYFGQIELSGEVIIDLCKIVNMFESPNFIYMRMHLLEKQTYPELLQSMFLLLMILPQNKIYNMLKARLDTTLHTRKKISRQRELHIDQKEALAVFHQIADKL